MRVWTLLLLVHCSSSLLPIDVVHVYQTSLASAPLATKSLTSGALYGVGDILAQRRLQLPTWDAKRTVRFAGTGVGAGAGAVFHAIFPTLFFTIPTICARRGATVS